MITHKNYNSKFKIINHETYIKRCLLIAKNGIGTTRPNPAVGAVIVFNDKIIGEGFTSSYGGNHAEVNAINSITNKSILKEATIYVTLEPCSHFGKTPPCADLIVKYKFKNVIIGCKDPNTLVSGKGIKRLQEAGINVVVGVLEKECLQHHKRFITFQHKKRPYIILKWAETADGFIAPKSKSETKPVFISNQYSQQIVHQWRSQEHAILVGTNTAIVDNPKLNVRGFYGENPVRIVIDRNLKIPLNYHLLDGSVKTIVIVDNKTKPRKTEKNLSFEAIDFSKNIAKQICEVLFKNQIQSVIIEGGTKTLQTFIAAKCWDEARVFYSNVNFGAGVKSPIFEGKIISQDNIKNDMLKIYTND